MAKGIKKAKAQKVNAPTPDIKDEYKDDYVSRIIERVGQRLKAINLREIKGRKLYQPKS